MLLLVGLSGGCARMVLTSGEIPAPALAEPEALDARIAVADFDRERLSLAIFHETNRVRRELGLPAFRYLPKLNEAADLEAMVGRVYRPPGHTNPFPTIGTPLERVKYVGLKPHSVMENIALLPIYETDIGLVLRDGKYEPVDLATREPPRPATYRGLAAKVVKSWMESPGHRMNIANPELRYLGCSAQPTVAVSGIDQLFCVQVFFTPQN